MPFFVHIELLVVGIVGDIGGWFVGGLERALAVPAVARAVLVPERVVDGARQLDRPKPLVFGFRVGRCGGHPAQVRQDTCGITFSLRNNGHRN